MGYCYIKTQEDIAYFLEKTNALHDGYVISVQYKNDGISKVYGGHYFSPEQTKLTLQILVTSIWDAVVELEFEDLLEWQIKDNQWEILDTAVLFDEKNRVVWLDDTYVDMEELRKGSYAIAESMKWRIVE